MKHTTEVAIAVLLAFFFGGSLLFDSATSQEVPRAGEAHIGETTGTSTLLPIDGRKIEFRGNCVTTMGSPGRGKLCRAVYQSNATSIKPDIVPVQGRCCNWQQYCMRWDWCWNHFWPGGRPFHCCKQWGTYCAWYC